jgi:Flp pilus assembly protein TadD
MAERLGALAPIVAGYALPFLLVLYLALEGGGYDAIVRGEIGIAAWWLVLLGSAVGALPVARVTPAGWAALGLLLAFGAWTAIGIGGSESSERTVAEVGRIAMLLGVVALAILAQGREGLRRTVHAVAAAIAVAGVVALLSRLNPEWFSNVDTSEHLAPDRLAFPLNYWNGLAALMALGIPLLLTSATQARYLLTSALAAAAIPAISLTAFFTLSRGGATETAIALIVLLALHPRRLTLLPTMLVSGAGSAILIAGANQRDALTEGIGSAAARNQGDELLAMAIVVCAGVGLLQTAITLVARHGLGPRIELSRPRAQLATAVAAALAIVIVLAAGVPGEISDRWEEFKEPAPASGGVERFESSSGSGRYQLWQAAVDANETEPLTGIGAGTFEYFWARDGTLSGFVRDAHSLYLESLAEVGIIGLAIILALLATVIGTGIRRASSGKDIERRVLVAGATAASVAFVVAAAVDWVWEVTVIPVAFLLLAAAILGPSAETRGRATSRFKGALPRAARGAMVALAVAGIVAVAIPLAGTASIRDSQSQFRDARLQSALEEARAAHDIQPYAATPSLQQALVLERSGQFDAAAEEATAATEQEPTNWRTWLVLSRIEAERGDASASVAAYREARDLNPRSPLFQ